MYHGIHESVPFVIMTCGICYEKFTKSEQLEEHKCFNRSLPIKPTEQVKDNCFNVVIKEEMPLDINDEIE